mgnify:FL=1|tara:strand:+ start:745 stop:1053 length:309 start_codon:yes stop_codon:yes gene_type:complete
MFNWLKDKMNSRINSEMMGCIRQNLRFIDFVNNQDRLNSSLDFYIEEIKEISLKMKAKTDSGENLTPDDNAELLDANKSCRRIWTNEFGGSAFKFDKEFSTK